MLNLKTTLLYLTLVCFIFGCKGMYKDEKSGVEIGLDTALVKININNDTSNIPLNNYNCVYFKIKKPYYLIQWDDESYGILWKRGTEDWYKGGQLDFTYVIQYATHFKDSCEAKQDLQRYLDSRITYKIVK